MNPSSVLSHGLLVLLIPLLFPLATGSLFSRFAATTKSANVGSHAAAPSDVAKQVLERFRTECKRVPVVSRRKSIDDSSLEIRLKWQDDKTLVTFVEVPFVAIPPQAFGGYFRRIVQEMPKADAMVQSVTELEKERHRVGLKGILLAPFPCSNRLLLVWKYLSQPAANEHLMVLTDRDNQGLIQKHQSPREKKSLVLAKATIAFWVRPVQDDSRRIVGSRLAYLFHGDIGGKIPKWVKGTAGPRGAYDTVHGLLKHLEKRQRRN